MSLQELAARITGSVILPEAADWDDKTDGLVRNGRKPHCRPAAVVRPASVADVQATVRFAAAHGIRVSPSSGGHNLSGIAVQTGIVLDLGDLGGMAIDAAAQVAELGPAVTSGALAAALEAEGLAFPVGHRADVPMGGYLLGGGIGWNAGEWGVAAFSVLSAEIVTADGELVQASVDENPDLFWALRGAGPAFFGVVVRYRLRLHSLPRSITTTVRVYPSSRVEELERWLTGAAAVSPRNVEFTLAIATAPGGTDPVASAIATVFAGTEEEARETLEKIGAWAPENPIAVQGPMPTPFATLYAFGERMFPRGARYAFDSVWSDNGPALFRTLAHAVKAAPSFRSSALGLVIPPHSALRQDGPSAACSMRGAYWGCAYGVWQEPSDDAANLAWLREGADALATVATGHYVGEADLDRTGRLESCLDPVARGRANVLRANYDPKGVFGRAAANAAVHPAAIPIAAE